MAATPAKRRNTNHHNDGIYYEQPRRTPTFAETILVHEDAKEIATDSLHETATVVAKGGVDSLDRHRRRREGHSGQGPLTNDRDGVRGPSSGTGGRC